MRFLSVFKSPERSTPPSQEEMAKMGKLIGEAMSEGWLLSTEGCMASKLGARVRSTNGAVTVMDGPFTEAKEMIGGFAILKADSKAHAVELLRRFLAVVGDGECELRQLYDGHPES
jgi:hypothetical protein